MLEKIKAFWSKNKQDKKLSQIILGLLLIVVIVYALWPFLFTSKDKAQKLTPPATMEKVFNSQGADIIVEKEEEVIIDDTNLTDPFSLKMFVQDKDSLSKSSKDKKDNDPVLEGIWVSTGTRVAFISGQTVQRGGVINGWRVTGISKTKVWLKRGSETKILELEAQL